MLTVLLLFFTFISQSGFAQKIDAFSDTAVDTVIKAVYRGGLEPFACIGNEGRAIYAQSPCSVAIEAQSLDFTAIYGKSINSTGIIGESTGVIGSGVIGRNNSNIGGSFSGGVADIQLEGDLGVIFTQEFNNSSSMLLQSNNHVTIELDNNSDVNEVGVFQVLDEEDNSRLFINENGSFAAGTDSEAQGFSSVALGNNSTASATGSIAIGNQNTSSGLYSLAVGNMVVASGNYSTAIGSFVNTNTKKGSLILGDSDPDGEGSTLVGKEDEFVARFNNGYYFMTSGDNFPRTGMFAPHGANAWSSISDVNRKENFQPLDDEQVLDKLASVDYSSWNYIGQEPSTFRHYGIMAQEFHELFGHDEYGTIGNDTLVNAIDMMGIAMSAIKGAKTKIGKLEKENETLQKRMAVIENQLSKIISSQKSLQD